MLYYVYNNDIGIDYKDVSQVFKGSGNWTQVSFDNGTTWEAIANIKNESSERFRAPFSIRNTSSTTGEHWVGHSIGSNWPTEEGHTYLAVADVKNVGAAMSRCAFGGSLPSGTVNIQSISIPITANQTAYTRVYRTFGHSTDNSYKGRFFLDFYPSAAGTLVQVDVKNYRQFDVTGWTSAQITALAIKENYDEVYLTLPSTFKGESNMTEDKFLAMGGIIRNDNVDGEEFFHNVAYNWIDLN